MGRHGRSRFIIVVSLAATGISADAAVGDIANLGTLGGGDSFGMAINAAGQVAGSSSTAAGQEHAFRWSAASGMQDLGTLGGSPSFGYAINDSGQVAGDSVNSAGWNHAFRWTQSGGMQDVGILGYYTSYGRAIDAGGQVYGYSQTTQLRDHAFRWNSTTGMYDLGALAGDNQSTAYAVNSSGQLTGYGSVQLNGYSHAIRWTSAQGFQDLGTLGGNTSYGNAINDSGQVVGYSDVSSSVQHAFRWTAGKGMENLGTLGGNTSCAYAIAGNSIALGSAEVSYNNNHAALWKNDGTIVDLDAWLDTVNPTQGAYWTLREVHGINQYGMITGFGTYNDGPGGLSDGSRAFVLDASSFVPEPGLVGIVLSMALPFLSRRRRGNAQDR